jgi:Ca2+-binding RTX toxin-like protein
VTRVSYVLSNGSDVELLRTVDPERTTKIHLTGNRYDNALVGNAGTNRLDGGAGADVMRGLDGDDIYRVDNRDDVVLEAAGGGNDTILTSVSYVLPTGAEVEILRAVGNSRTAPIHLTGNAFENSLYGNAGRNVINGGGGSDTLYGRGGNDVFVFDSAHATNNVDRIADFWAKTDVIHLDNKVFDALAHGRLTAGAFNTGNAATELDDRIIYDRTTGALIYDANGSDSGGATQFATLTPGRALTHLDFYVV